MRTHYRRASRAVHALLAAGLLPVAAPADTLTVCPSGCDSTTVQGGINAATDGDTILLATSGTLTEAGIVVLHSVVIQGFEGTVLRAAASRQSGAGRILTIPAGETVVVRDLTLRWGDSGAGDGGAVHNAGHLTLDAVVVEQSDADRGAGVFNDGTLVALASTLQDNTADSDGGNLFNSGDAFLGFGLVDDGLATNGAGIFNTGSLELDSVEIHSNDAGSFGGGLYQEGSSASTTVRRAELSFNLANSGGGIGMFGGMLAVRNAYFFDNQVSASGGALHINAGAVTVSDSTFRHNTSDNDGGAVSHVGSSTPKFANSTFYMNWAEGDGGAFFIGGGKRVRLASSTVASNTADSNADELGDGGGFYMAPCIGICAVTRAELQNSIVADNVDASTTVKHPDCSGEVDSDGYNLVESEGVLPGCDVTGDPTGVQTATDPKLAAIADNGGVPTSPGNPAPWTQALLSGSPAIGAGNPGGCVDYDGAALARDARRADRIATCDLGAFEFGGSPPVFVDDFESRTTGWWSATVD